MKDFVFDISTKILFGKNQLENLPKEIKKYGKKVLFVYGSVSIKKTGLYDRVSKVLKEAGIEYYDLAGIVPNPRIDKVREGIKLVKENNIDFILAVGGGSVIDTSKLIGVGSSIEADPWDIVIGKEKPLAGLAIGVILTLSATGSEMNAGSVITNEESGQKLGWGSSYARPKFAIMDPSLTFSVNKDHTAAGTADIMSHTMENYFSLNDGAYFQDRQAEGILKTCINYGPIALENPSSYEARANLMWAGSWAINGLLSAGKSVEWSVHPMEHELSAKKDITHGLGLAILTPHWLKYCLNEETLDKIANFGYNVFALEKTGSAKEDALKAIGKLSEFFDVLGLKVSLRDLGFKEEDLPYMAHRCLTNRNKQFIDGFIKLYEEDILNIYKMAY
ncbi:MAG: iron-containing alcohol dehydrogenase [Tissierellia bacterium]|nr:iron-containing alcohol dehydrogenase [Tissierellia bacterium]